MLGGKDVCHLRNGGTSVVIHLRTSEVIGLPVIAYWGQDLGEASEEQLASLVKIVEPQTVSGGITQPPRLTVIPQEAHAWQGTPGLSILRKNGNDQFAFDLRVTNVDVQEHKVKVSAKDTEADVQADITLEVTQSGLLSQQLTIINASQNDLDIQEAYLSFPLPATANELLDMTGRHLRERHLQRHAFTVGRHVRDSRRGRPGADATMMIVAGRSGFGFEQGLVHAVHLAWSGSQRISAERGPNYQAFLQTGELFGPGEMVLKQGEQYQSPLALGSWGQGLSQLSHRFHDHLRSRTSHPTLPRPVTMNTWEAVYFDMKMDRLKAIAEAAASVGAERYVLDDGWFKGRRDDTAGLGDWFVDKDVWPQGLQPLWKHVDSLGMQCGLWVEPEMINLDSDVARKHPEWILRPTSKRLPVVGRTQYVIDLSNDDAYKYIFKCLDDILTTYPLIKYLKWDHNRDLIESGNRHGRMAVHDNVVALYRLMDELKAKHAGLEIESCASGGARVDLGILQRTDRIWTSDCTDPIERLTIQKYTGLLVPNELMGAHIGAPHSHTTGRAHALSMRAGHALMAHMGIEWDISSISKEELDQVRKWIALHKKWREVLHTGRAVYSDTFAEDNQDVRGVVSKDGKRALFTFTQVATSQSYPPSPITFPGLQATTSYRVTMVSDPAIEADRFVGQSKLAWRDANQPCILSGAMLMSVGLQVPVLLPESILVIEVEAV